MTKLRLEQAPVASLPRRFLFTAPWWGVLAGVLLMVDGDVALHMRWNPSTLALVHVFTLGVLGNAMFGSILQFLPAAAGVTVHGGMRSVTWLHGCFNVGVALLVVGLHQHWPVALNAAAVVLPLAFVALALMVGPGMVSAVGQRLVRAGFGVALGFALATATLGGMLALGLSGYLDLPLAEFTDVHASWGVLGWIVVLIATVARVVMPMFQGTGMVSGPLQTMWLTGVVSTLLGGAYGLVSGDTKWLAGVVAMFVFLFAGAALWLQWRASRLRRGPLVYSWRVGMISLALAALTLPALPGGMVAGALGLSFALPLLMTGMMLEIVPFIGWIELHRQCGRGVQVPGVQRLLPDADKYRVLMAQLPLLLLPASVVWPSVWLARGAGAALLLSWSLICWTQFGVSRRASHFLRALQNRR